MRSNGGWVQFDVYHAPVHVIGRPGDAIDVARGCSFLGSATCRLQELIGAQAESFELIDDVSKNDEFLIIKNEEFRIKNEEFWFKMMNVAEAA